jgi:hypothetical protein
MRESASITFWIVVPIFCNLHGMGSMSTNQLREHKSSRMGGIIRVDASQ